MKPKITDNIPIMKFGKYAGVRVDQLPEKYCRWLLTQDFPEEIAKWAREKVKSNTTDFCEFDVTRHALDSFSLRFMNVYFERKDRSVGFATFVARLADSAFQLGSNVSKHRHQDEEIIKEYNGMKFVFNKKGEVKTLITVFS
jgi:hypothetical protein